MEQICQATPDLIVNMYKAVSSGGLLAFYGIIVALLIPFALFLINNNNRKEKEKDFEKVERAVILTEVMHIQSLVISLFIGGLASLFFIDNSSCNSAQLTQNIIIGIIVFISICKIMQIIQDIIKWISHSSKPDSINSFCFKKWKHYLSNIADTEYYGTWENIFSNENLPEELQPAYISLFLEKIHDQKPSEKYISYRILCDYFDNLQMYNPGVMEAIINNIEISRASIRLLLLMRDNCNPAGDFDVLINFIDKKLQKNNDSKESKLIAREFLFDGIKHFFTNKEFEEAFVNAIPTSWRLSTICQNNSNNMTEAIANIYPELVFYLLDRQNNDNLGIIEHINASVIGSLGNDEIDERLLADVCEIYDNPLRIIIPERHKTLEQMLIENYSKLEPRYFASASIYTPFINKKHMKQSREEKAILILSVIFPNIISNSDHIKKMKREIKKQLKEKPNEYYLERLSRVYSALSRNP